ncbi:hypothetical protein HK101_004488 [Irineochytrium annulatum]|nr:hypothetical protein HK101_004488 [Irineochytrium annulatum]
MQSGFQYASTLSAARAIVRANGVAGLYQGVLPVFLGAGPVMGICYASFTYSKLLIARVWGEGDPGALTIPQVAVAAERLKILLQVEKPTKAPSSALKAFLESWKALLRAWTRGGGVRGFYRGTLLTMARDVPGDAAYFATFESTKRGLVALSADPKAKPGFNPLHTLLAGGLAGCANWIVCIPIDDIKTKWQQSPTGSSFFKLVSQQSPRRLYAGLGPTLLRAFPASGAFFLGVEGSAALVAWSSTPSQ